MKQKLLILALPALFIAVSLRGQNAKDPAGPYRQQIDSILRMMTLEEKIGQLSLFTSDWESTGPVMNSNYKQLIGAGNVGAVFNAYTVRFLTELQRTAIEKSRLKIPLLFGYDVIHGHRTIFPIPLAQSCSWDLDAIRQSDSIAAREATAEGLDWTFSPMVDIARDPRWGRVSEGAGEDTWLGCRIAEARVKGFQGRDLKDPHSMMACAKHFAAYGAPMAGRDYNPVDMSQVSLYEWYLPPYHACVDAGVGTVMTSFNEIAGIPSTASHWLLTDLLRNTWGFSGFVVTDYTSINELIPHGIAGNIEDAAALAMNAGVDMDMQGSTFLDSMEKLVKENRVSTDRIDEAVRAVLAAKFRLGLFDDPYRNMSEQRQETEIMTASSMQFARQFAAESCVLLKNNHHTLPIPAGVHKIAVIGPLADSKRDMLGNWSAAGRWEDCVTLLEGIRNNKGIEVVYQPGCSVTGGDTDGFGAAVDAANGADFVILALGESGGMSGEAASRTQLGLPGVQEQLAEAVIAAGKPTVVVLFNGRPLCIQRLAQQAPAILETWFGGTQAGNAIADVLFGQVNPSGKLTMSFPRNEGQIPVFYNAKNTGRPYSPQDSLQKYVSRYIDSPNSPLYPFGYGLSYTTFDYSGLDVRVDGDMIRVKVNVTNSGPVAGKEIVQLYVRDLVGTLTRPVMELKGFRKVFLEKGETRTVEFTLREDDLAFYHSGLERYAEPGDFGIFVGKSSDETLSKVIYFPASRR